MSSSTSGSFSELILAPFLRYYLPRSNDPYAPFPLDVRHNDQTLALRRTRRQESFLVIRMVRIMDGDCQWIAKHGRRFLERYSMLGEIIPSLLRMPFELHNNRLQRQLHRAATAAIPNELIETELFG